MALTKVKDLCECFKALIERRAVNIYTAQEAKNTGFMFHIPNTTFIYYNCPCCGVEVRDIEVDVKDFQKLIN